MSERQERRRAADQAVVCAAGVAIAVAAPFVLSDFRTFQLTMAACWAIALTGLALITGFTGQISLGHGAFVGLGAYTAAILVGRHDWPHLLAFPAAFGVCFVAGGIVGLPALRLRGLYLALVTLGIAVLFPVLVTRYGSLTGGPAGINVSRRAVQPPAWLAISVDDYLYGVVLLVLIVVLVVTANIVTSPLGDGLMAIRDHELVAASLGVSAARYKTTVFALGSAFAGLGGAGYAVVIRYVGPGSFLVLLSVTLLAALVVGGAASVSGAIVGGLFMQFTPYATQSFSVALSSLVYGVVLIVVMLVARGGITGFVLRQHRRLVAGAVSSGDQSVALTKGGTTP